VDVNREAAQETVDIIQGEGRAATAFACDVTDSEAVKAVVDGTAWPYRRASQHVGYATMGRPIKLDEAAWRRTIDLNVTNCFVAAPLRRHRQRFVRGGDPLNGLSLRRLLCR
jgi:NAD(P)-dependent dehydrogenase (short-subunit alcohol dehydrogenase family)